jgi:hypothetical protein
MRLWVPAGSIDADTAELSGKIVTGQQAVADFLETRITPVEFLEIVDDCGVDIDEYLDTLAFNLRW